MPMMSEHKRMGSNMKRLFKKKSKALLFIALSIILFGCGSGGNSAQSGSGSPIPTTNTKGAPFILYTDAVTGPITGGENNQGCYLSIYGMNFGNLSGLGTRTRVYIGGKEVAGYRVLDAAVVAPKIPVQRLIVQVGSIGNPVFGKALPVTVVVNNLTSNANHTFTPIATTATGGRILFVSLTGNDTTAVPGQINRPYRHLQTTGLNRYTKGAYADLRAGDHIVIRGGNWSDTGFDGAWLRFRDALENGTSSKWIHITSYPGEKVTYTAPAGARGGFAGPASAYAGTTGQFVSFSNFDMRVSPTSLSDAAPFNEQSGTGPWRVVNNNIGPWPSIVDARAGGYSGGGKGTKIYGNYIHDIRRICDSVNTGTPEFIKNCLAGAVGAGQSLLNHGIYIDSGSTNAEIAYNYILNVPEGNLIQSYSSIGTPITGLKIYNNRAENSGKFGLNISSESFSGYIFNNVIVGAHNSGLTFNVAGNKAMNWKVAHNTFVNNNISGSLLGQISNQWGNYGLHGTVQITNNIVYSINNTPFYVNSGNSDIYMQWGKNITFGTSSPNPPIAGSLILIDPAFTNVTKGDYSLSRNSPAIDAAKPLAGAINPALDFALHPRVSGLSADIGACEFQQP
jgi:hypothetical protein